MKRLAMLSLGTVVSALLLTACGGGGGGSVAGPTALATGTFIKSFVPAGAVTFTNYPFDNQDVKSQNLYLASEVNGSGNIATLRFQRGYDGASVTCPNTTIKLGHSILSALTPTFASNMDNGRGSSITVLNNATLSIPAGVVGDWFDIPLTTTFSYNGVDNLVVQIENATACSAKAQVNFYNGVGSNRRLVSLATDTTPGTPEYNPTTGTASLTQTLMQFVFGGGDNPVGLGVSGSAVPFSSTMRLQNMYPISEITGTGPITGVALKTFATTTAGSYTVTLQMGHTTKSDLIGDYTGNYDVDAPVTLVSNATFTVPGGIPAGTYLWLPFSGSFTYNGNDNLIVDIMVSSLTTTLNQFEYSTTSNVRSFVGPGTSNTSRSVKFRFNGGPMDVITDSSSSENGGFAMSPFGRVKLYRATELGTAGTINSIACRLTSAPTATSYSNYKVIIGHSNVDALSTTSADNFVSQTTAVNGTVTVPAGLGAGDWLEVPLSTPFAYDGKSNLVVWMGTTAPSGASANTSCRLSVPDAVRYPGQMGAGVPGDASITVQNYKYDMQFKIAK
jgi:hypothetical protein